jgi:signal transduction histidine kinase
LNKSLLLLSKIDNSQFVELEDLCLNEVLHRYIDDYQEVYAYRYIGIDVEEQGRFTVRMNETLAVVLVTNLLKNSFVHNIDKGRVRIEVNASSITFSNTGMNGGLDEKRIFERFYQGAQKKEGSTGLGLAIVEAICRQSRLKIRYQYADGWHQVLLYR